MPKIESSGGLESIFLRGVVFGYAPFWGKMQNLLAGSAPNDLPGITGLDQFNNASSGNPRKTG